MSRHVHKSFSIKLLVRVCSQRYGREWLADKQTLSDLEVSCDLRHDICPLIVSIITVKRAAKQSHSRPLAVKLKFL